jgi:acyl-CoA synthetase (AMP-forming)/AMP-acid ligase II
MNIFPDKLHQRLSSHFAIRYNNVIELLDHRALSDPDRIFLISPGSKIEKYTYQEFRDLTLHASRYLSDLGFQKGDRVNLIIPNSFEFLILYFASFRIGLTVVPINQDLAIDEILFIIKNCSSNGVFIDSSYYFKLENIIEKLDPVRIFKIDGIPEFETVQNSKQLDLDYTSCSSISEEALIIYTSGTTGNPKGVVLSHLNLLSDAQAIKEWFNFNENTRTLCILPLFHNNGQVVTLLAPLFAGGSTVIVKGKSSLMSFWGLIRDYQVTWTSVMPSILSILLHLPVKRSDTTLRGIICGGQVLKPAVQEAFESRFNVSVFEGFGLTETTSFACFNGFPEEARKKGSVGPPLSVNEIKIADDNDNEVDAMVDGEICIRGINVAIEYLGLHERNNYSFRNGWFHSGDFGYKDNDGWLFFKERKDNLIIKGGENIYPAELENVLYQHPEIAECAVIGIPDDLLGEDLCAFVKLKENSNLTEKALKQFCGDKIASFKLAKRILILNQLTDLPEIPKGSTQKILYNKLKDYYLTKVKVEI